MNHDSGMDAHVSGFGSRWTEVEDEQLESMLSSGWGYKSLTRFFPGRTRDAIRSRHRELQGDSRYYRNRRTKYIPVAVRRASAALGSDRGGQPARNNPAPDLCGDRD